MKERERGKEEEEEEEEMLNNASVRIRMRVWQYGSMAQYAYLVRLRCVRGGGCSRGGGGGGGRVAQQRQDCSLVFLSTKCAALARWCGAIVVLDIDARSASQQRAHLMQLSHHTRAVDRSNPSTCAYIDDIGTGGSDELCDRLPARSRVIGMASDVM